MGQRGRRADRQGCQSLIFAIEPKNLGVAVSERSTTPIHFSNGTDHPNDTMKLAELVQELADCDKQERFEMILDYARSLPPLPERFAALRDPDHRVEECQSPIYLFAEKSDTGGVHWYADVPMEAPTIRGVASLLWEGTQDADPDEITAISYDIINQSGLKEILGMQRVNGLAGLIRRLKKIVAETAAG